MSEVLSKYAVPGGEIELKAIGREKEPEDSRKRRSHRSQVLKVLTESRVEVAMPIEDGKLILLPVDGEYDMYFTGITWFTSVRRGWRTDTAITGSMCL